VKCYIISAVLWLEYLQTSLYISNSDEIRTPQVEFAKEASQFQYMFWQKHDITV
jgi:hypothetical protein